MPGRARRLFPQRGRHYLRQRNPVQRPHDGLLPQRGRQQGQHVHLRRQGRLQRAAERSAHLFPADQNGGQGRYAVHL